MNTIDARHAPDFDDSDVKEWDSDFWDELIEFIKTGTVVPILGPELFWVQLEGEMRPVFHVVADLLADKLKIPRSTGADNPLDDTAKRFVAGGGKRSDIFRKLHLVMNEVTFELPPALVRLAEIDAFKLFVTLTFDSLMVQAINQSRYQGAALTRHLAFSTSRVDDLPSEISELKEPVVYSLLGKHSIGPEYVITDEDTLEFVCALQSENRRPMLLFDELSKSNLLMLGCSFPDWLARFFIRTAKSRPLAHSRDEWEYWIDTRFSSNPSLIVFLERFSKTTKHFANDPVAFVEALSREWRHRSEKENGKGGALATSHVALDSGSTEALPANRGPAIFISYASEDRAVAIQLAASLEAAGVNAWIDRDQLAGGDVFEKKIMDSINKCTLFLPLISQAAEMRTEGFFRKEWRWADNRRQGIADEIPFIVPAVLGNLKPELALVPDSFKATHWMKCVDGKLDDSQILRLRTLIRQRVKSGGEN